MLEEESKRSHRGGGVKKESWRRNHGGNVEEESWRRNHGGGTLSMHHGGVIIEEAARRRQSGGIPEGSQEADRKHPDLYLCLCLFLYQLLNVFKGPRRLSAAGQRLRDPT